MSIHEIRIRSPLGTRHTRLFRGSEKWKRLGYMSSEDYMMVQRLKNRRRNRREFSKWVQRKDER